MQSVIEGYVQRRFDEFESDDFALLSRVPSANTMRYLAAYRALDIAQRRLFRQAVSSRAVLWWGFSYDPDADRPETRLWDEVQRMAPFPKGVTELGRPRAQPRELQRTAEVAFGQLLGCRPEKSDEPGDWFYRGRLLDEDISVQVRYTTKMAQVVYGLKIGEFSRYHSFSVENFFGLGIGDWDLISIDKAHTAFAILKDMVVQGVREYKVVQGLLKTK